MTQDMKLKKKKGSSFHLLKIKVLSMNAKAFFMFLLTAVLIFGLYFLVCSPKRYDLSVGAIARETITASKDIVDEIATEEKRNSAASAVEPSYHFEDGVAEQVSVDLDNYFRKLSLVQQYGQTLLNENETDESIKAKNYTDEELNYASTLLSDDISLTKYQIRTLLRTQTQDFETMVSTVKTAVSNSMSATIREGQLAQAIQNIIQIVGYRLDVSLTQNIVPTVLRACIKPNMVIDQEATDESRIKARESVDKVVYIQGQNIIREGERVSLNQLEMLRALGLLKNNRVDLSSYGGAAIIILISLFALFVGLRLQVPEILLSVRKLSVVLIVVTIAIGIAALFLTMINAYFIPIVFASMLLTVLLGSRVGYVSVVPVSVMIAGLSAGSNSSYQVEMILLLIIGSLTGVFSVQFLKRQRKRTSVIICGLVDAVLTALIILAMSWMTSSAENKMPLANILWSCGGSLVSGILAIAMQPVFENAFNLATSSRLLDLINPNQPLLRRLMLEAPGTYHHAIVVANLSEAAAERIGGNALLARAGAYYHDIGKLKRPLYFKENQLTDNPHDRTDPYVSAAIVTSHTTDGVILAQQAHLPLEIQDIIAQHHGDTAAMYFYHKALQMADGTPVDIKDFRYNGRRPSTKEAAIVMIADTVEAAVRSMKNPTLPEIKKFIERLIRGKLEDGQLSDAPILLCDLDEIADALTGVLKGVYHERIEYPPVSPHNPIITNANNNGDKISEEVKEDKNRDTSDTDESDITVDKEG